MADNKDLNTQLIIHWYTIDFKENIVHIMYSIVPPKGKEKVYLAERHLV